MIARVFALRRRSASSELMEYVGFGFALGLGKMPAPCRIENAQRKAGRFAYFISSGKR
jgi:hypothetical protein